MKKLTMALALTSCTLPTIGDQESLNEPYNKYKMMSYQYNNTEVIWTYTWIYHTIGASAKRDERTVYYIKDGKITDIVELGKDRSAWANLLLTHNIYNFDLIDAILTKTVYIDMPLQEVLLAIGFPTYGPHSNPNVLVPVDKINGDGELYYQQSRINNGFKATKITLEGDKVTNIESTKPTTWQYLEFPY